jgi:hypothetical protein
MRAEVDHGAGLAALVAVDHDEVVELLVDVDAGLVDGGDDGFALFGQVFEQFDDRFGVVGGEARGRFVEEQDRGVVDEFEGDVDALALAAGEGFALGGADDGVFLSCMRSWSRTLTVRARISSSVRSVRRRAEK